MAAVGGFKTWLNPTKPGGVQPGGAAGLIAGLLGASLIAGSISKRRKRKQRERYRRQYFREIAQGLIEMGAPVKQRQTGDALALMADHRAKRAETEQRNQAEDEVYTLVKKLASPDYFSAQQRYEFIGQVLDMAKAMKSVQEINDLADRLKQSIQDQATRDGAQGHRGPPGQRGAQGQGGTTNFQEDTSWINKPHNPNHPITSVKDVYRTIDEKNHWRKQVKRVEDMKREKYIMTNQPTRLTKVSDRFLTKITKAERKKYKLTSGDPMDRAVKVYTQIISIIETEIAKEKAKNKISIADLGTQGGASPFYKTSITSTSPVYSA